MLDSPAIRSEMHVHDVTQRLIALPRAEAGNFCPVAAGLHAAPPAAAVAGCIDEQPATIVGCAFAHAIELAMNQQIDRILHYRPERSLQKRGLIPDRLPAEGNPPIL